MKTRLLLPLFLFASLLPVAAPAQDRAAEAVAALAASFRSREAYEVDFEVTAGEFRASGNYAVEGGRYRLTMDDSEVFAEGGIRYVVDRSRREVTIDRADTTGRNILDDPVHAFDFLNSDYTASLLSEGGGTTVVRLVPASPAAASSGDITLALSTEDLQPRSIAYDFDGDRIEVRIVRIGSLRGAVQAFDAADYPGYEWIDFR